MPTDHDSEDPFEAALAQYRAKRARAIVDLTAADAAIAGIERARQQANGILPKDSAQPIPQHTEFAAPLVQPTVAPIGPPPDSPFYGVGLAKAAVRQLGLCNKQPQTVRQLWGALHAAGVTVTSNDPEGTLSWQLRKREAKFKDVILIGNGQWGMVNWFTDKEVERIRSSRTSLSTRNKEDHKERTKAGMALARSQRGLMYGRSRIVTADRMSVFLKARREGKTILEAANLAGFSAGAYGFYRKNYELDSWNPGDAWPPPPKKAPFDPASPPNSPHVNGANGSSGKRRFI